MFIICTDLHFRHKRFHVVLAGVTFLSFPFPFTMVTNINKSTTSTSQTSSITPNPNYSISIEGLKRKFQRVNQEIVKQNVMLQEHLARSRQEQHHVLQENVRLKGRIVALESKLREAEGVCTDTKVNKKMEIIPVIF